VSDIRKFMMHLQKYSLSIDTGCSHYAEAGPRKHTDPIQHVNVDEAVTECKIQQISCGVNIFVEIKCVADTSVLCIKCSLGKWWLALVFCKEV
jgi:hypothetical protein